MCRRIVFISNNSGGLYDFRSDLMRALLDRGDHVFALTPFDIKVDEIDSLGVTVFETKLDRRGINPLKDFRLFLDYKYHLKRLHPDLVITYTIKPNIYAALACRLLRIPYVANITGLGSVFQNDNLLKRIVIYLYRLSLKRAKTVFFENSANKEAFEKDKIVTEEQSHVLNGAGVNIDRFGYSPYPNDTGVRFLFIGRIMKEKGVDELFEAMRKLVENGIDCSLDMLGYFDEDYKEVIQKYEEEGWLKYHGYQPDVRPFIANCHCFVLPSWHEGMANTNLECAAMGRPIITTNIPGCLEAVIDGRTGFLVEKQNISDLYQKMKFFCSLDYNLRKQMGIEGRKHITNVFDKKLVVKETLESL